MEAVSKGTKIIHNKWHNSSSTYWKYDNSSQVSYNVPVRIE